MLKPKGPHVKKPKKFDYNLIVIGAGSAGLVSSYIASTLKAKVALIEKHKMGGDCLNTGCVPSKALIRSAKVYHYMNRARQFGFQSGEIKFEFSEVMDRIRRVIKKVEPHDSVDRYTKLGVDCIHGNAVIKSPYTVEINGTTLTTRAIIIATGAKPFVPPLPGLNQIHYLTSDNLWDLQTQPKKLVVLGGGPIGIELAQSFARLGSEVTIVEMAPRILIREDDDVADLVVQKLKKDGLHLRTSHRAESVVVEDGKKILLASHKDQIVKLEFDEILVAIGRKANISGFGLEELGVSLNQRGTIDHNDFLQTNFENIFVCGDVAGPYQFTHTAAHQAYYACVNALLHPFTKWIPSPFNKSLKVDYSVIPWATYCDPEIATVGLTEKAAKQKNLAYEITTYSIDDLDRAIADEEDYGLVKVLTQPGSDRILGATIVAHNASDLIVEFIAAMKHGFGLGDILSTIHIYPTMAEANKYLAGNWKKARVPEKLLIWTEKFFSWLRG